MSEGSHGEQEIADAARTGGQLDQALDQIRRALAGLQFGEVTVVVQDGVVVQVERTERRRLRKGDR